MFEPLIILLAFILGFALARASTCSVAATMRLIEEGKPDWLFGLFIATSWSGITLLLLTTVFSSDPATPGNFLIGWQLFFGAALMGMGAVLNQACFIGSVGRISTGNLSYLLTFAGLASAKKLGTIPEISRTLEATPIEGSVPWSDVLFWLMIALFVLTIAISLRRLVLARNEATVALVVIGVAAALIYAAKPDWGYEHMLDNLVNYRGFSSGFLLEFTVLALFVGAIFSSMLRDRFHPHFSGLVPSFMHFIGGLFMGLGANAVPGGNDSLVLWVIPSSALHGIIAYAVMLVVVALLIITMRRFSVAM